VLRQNFKGHPHKRIPIPPAAAARSRREALGATSFGAGSSNFKFIHSHFAHRLDRKLAEPYQRNIVHSFSSLLLARSLSHLKNEPESAVNL
jgi:hypothetical protein